MIEAVTSEGGDGFKMGLQQNAISGSTKHHTMVQKQGETGYFPQRTISSSVLERGLYCTLNDMHVLLQPIHTKPNSLVLVRFSFDSRSAACSIQPVP